MTTLPNAVFFSISKLTSTLSLLIFFSSSFLSSPATTKRVVARSGREIARCAGRIFAPVSECCARDARHGALALRVSDALGDARNAMMFTKRVSGERAASRWRGGASAL